MEISGPIPLGVRGPGALPVQDMQRPDAPGIEPPRVEPQDQAQDAGAEPHDHPRQDLHSAASRDIIALRRAVARGQRPAGPPPAFEVSLLEVESDLQQKLARMEAERAQARDAGAVQGAALETGSDEAERATAAPEAIPEATPEAPEAPRPEPDDRPDAA